MSNDRHAAAAVAELYHAWLTGLVLTVLNHRDAAVAEEFVFRLFRRQHLEKFLPGLDKLGLANEPHAIAAAKYHYFSNQLGGVCVEYLAESEHKAWIRYPPPRWIWLGTAICAIPTDVNRAMLRGWHAHNGVSLGNPRLGFVCTKTTVDGQAGLEGYYLEYGHDLALDERLQFRPHEDAPYIDPTTLPELDVSHWPAERRDKAARNYAMDYVRTALPVLTELIGAAATRELGRLSARQIGMQWHREIATLFGITSSTADDFLTLFEALVRGQGDVVERRGDTLVQQGWRLFRGLPPPEEAVFDAWNGLWEGLLLAHDRFLRLDVERRIDGDDMYVEWRVRTTR